MKMRSSIAAAALACMSVFAARQSAYAADQSDTHAASAPSAPHETIAPAFATAIANVPGKTISALTVDYAPGGKSRPHRHGHAFVVAYVLEGAIRSGIDGGEPRVYHAGESWTEKPGAHHTVSENASATEPAKLLAIFIADTADKNLVTFDGK